MTTFKVLHRAKTGERFAPDAWDRQVGKTVPFNVGERVCRCKLLAAEVSADGGSVELTLETDEIRPDFDPTFYRPLRGASIGFTPTPAEPLRLHGDWRGSRMGAAGPEQAGASRSGPEEPAGQGGSRASDLGL